MGKDDTTEYSKVWRELTQFFDPDPRADWSKVLLKGATEATVWDIEPVG